MNSGKGWQQQSGWGVAACRLIDKTAIRAAMPGFPATSGAALRRQAAFCLGLMAWLYSTYCMAVVGPAREDRALNDHVVMVLIRNAGKAGFCSGVVMAPTVVLTAAHCGRPAGDMRVFYRDAANGPVFVAVRAVLAHPGFRVDATTRRVASIDLALIETATPLDARFSAPALDKSGEIAIGQDLLMAGFGVAREGEQSSAGVLRAVNLAARAPLSKVLVWAEDATGAGGGACVGDSGGPIFSADGAKLLAIIAWSEGKLGRHCGALTQGILVAPALDWIQATMQRWTSGR
jgi:Trypsin